MYPTVPTFKESMIEIIKINGDYGKVDPVRGLKEVKDLLEIIEDYGSIAGGYARYCASPLEEPILPQDIDIFCDYADLSKSGSFSTLKQRLMLLFGLPIDETAFSVTFKHTLPIQLIKPRSFKRGSTFGLGTVLLEKFDLSVTRAALTNDNKVLVHTTFMEDEARKLIRVLRGDSFVLTMDRIQKYIKKGYSIDFNSSLALFQMASWSYQNPFKVKDILKSPMNTREEFVKVYEELLNC